MDNPVTMVLDFPLSIVVAVPLLSFLLSFFAILWLIKIKADWVLDQPNERSLHLAPVSRIGGLGLLSGVIVSWLCFSVAIPDSILMGIGLLMVISLADDVRRVPVWCRLMVHAVVAISFSIGFLSDAYGWGVMLLMAVAVIWMSNLYNFMDGSDGLAGGMAVIGFGIYGWLAYAADNNDFAAVNFSLAAAAVAFLMHNFYPARIFMGDVGSIPLGYLAAVIGVLGWLDHLWSLWVPVLIFSPFIADATVTLMKRVFQGKRIWQAHREHYYQRMVQSGLGHRDTALVAYGLMLAAGASAVWANAQDVALQVRIVAVWGCVYLALMILSDRSQKIPPGRG
ncbi:UDP-N-acetylmuramyl pentapeptide phosphotransferase/UDP-N-acetylglucosamine-1-phosphate transferase [Nitrosomonas ureae]|uniref:MraY family glycosyltransferase n=1 Tax=Nitrosomonas ureae TaxID=44577 RepID=UPI000D75B707|nr:glycosyltransferase family 4 protein [Nitrosomonas ureae]PXX14039.1 UDP-N-acetylmuramyl pentapeptide phosphotransferase/UDP-N-acetylglucosamine-1-phosphate transferase [Nitrosomonas ureae]